MAIFQRGDIWYVDYYVGEKRVREAVGHRKGDAVARLGKVRAAQKENRFFDMKKEYTFIFDDLLERYQEAFRDQRCFGDKERHLELFMRTFKGKLLGEITVYDLERLRNEMKATPVRNGVERMKEGYTVRNASPKVKKERTVGDVNRTLSTLRHMFSKAVEWRMAEKSPFTGMKGFFYKENNQRLRFLTEAEEERLLFYCNDCLNDCLKHIVLTALNSGMRRGEILSLKWSQIRDGFIYLTLTKTDIPRQIPLNETLKELFQSIPRHIKSEYVFCNSDGKPFPDVARHGFNTAVERAGIENFHFHDLRHTFASNLVKKGVSLLAVQKLLGHKDIKMTMRYSHLAEDYMVDAVKSLDRKEKQGVSDQSSHKVVTNEAG